MTALAVGLPVAGNREGPEGSVCRTSGAGLTFNHMVERSATLDHTYAALAHPTRRAMLHLLKAGPMRVTDLADPFEVSLAASSKHVNMLERAGLLSRTVAGRDHWLTLDPRPLLDAGGWIDTYRLFWEERLDTLDQLLGGDR